MTRPGFRAAELVGFIRWARRGVVVQGDQLVVDCWPLDPESILERAEAAGWITRGKRLPVSVRPGTGELEQHAWGAAAWFPPGSRRRKRPSFIARFARSRTANRSCAVST
jgi:hypothetical protein